MSEKQQSIKTTEQINRPSPYRAIIIDNSDFSRNQMTNLLSKLNVKVVGELKSIKAATQAIPKTDANLVILDVVMPDAKGIELIKKFQNQLSQIFFVIVSALNTKHIIIESIRAGASDFLSKPLDQRIFTLSILKIQKKIDEAHTEIQAQLDNSP